MLPGIRRDVGRHRVDTTTQLGSRSVHITLMSDSASVVGHTRQSDTVAEMNCLPHQTVIEALAIRALATHHRHAVSHVVLFFSYRYKNRLTEKTNHSQTTESAHVTQCLISWTGNKSSPTHGTTPEHGFRPSVHLRQNGLQWRRIMGKLENCGLNPIHMWPHS